MLSDHAHRRIVASSCLPEKQATRLLRDQRLLDKHGDVRMIDLLTIIAADCPRLKEQKKSDWCGVRYAQL
jgi:hypothetical protein